jgi:predicted Zn-dependent peptidase
MLGPFYIQGQAAAEQAIEEIRKILDVVEEFKGTSISAEQLAGAQKLWIEEFSNAARSTDGICGALLDSELYRLGTNYTSGFPDLVRRQDPETVKIAAKDWFFPGGVVLLVRGPAASLKSGLETLGAVQPVAP